MAIKKFSINEAVQIGWNTMKNNFGIFIAISIVIGMIVFIPIIIAILLKAGSPNILIAGWLLLPVISPGLIKISLNLIDNVKGEFRDLFHYRYLFFKYLCSTILYLLMVFVGLILLIIPGIFLGIRFQFYAFFIVDKGLDPIESLKRSYAITKGAYWDLLLFSFFLVVINFLGALALLIGLLVTIPMSVVATAFVYRKLLDQTKVDEIDKVQPTTSMQELKVQHKAMQVDLPKVEQKPAPVYETLRKGIDVKTAFGYKGATILFKLKIENNTSDPISDIKVYPYVPDVFLLKEKEKSIALIEPGSSQTVTFEIRPTGECGECNVSGRVNYYDMASRKRQDIELETKSLSIVCPMLHGKEISEADWHDAVSNLVKTEESTKEIDMPAETLFTMVSRIIKDMHMYMLKPEVTQNQKLFNGVARFYGEGVKGLRYAAHVEVVGGTKKSKLLLKAWAEKEDALTGFYHGILDEIEKRVNVKGYIDDSIVQQYIHIGNKIGTQVKDSFVQRSIVGIGARKCHNCGREVEANEKFCLECGAKLGG